MQKTKQTILQYSIAAVAYLAGNAAYTQIIYTDIEPDVVLDEDNEVYGFDLDEDGLNDFNFFKKIYTTYIHYLTTGNVNALFAGVFDTMANGLIGDTFYLSGSGGYTRYLPYNLKKSDVINHSGNFHNDNYQTLAMHISLSSYFAFTFKRGGWYPFYDEDITNHYLGFRFTDEATVRRYGWIRCSVIDSGQTLIIHDYAYELEPNQAIIAGDSISYTPINEQQNTLDASVYSFAKTVYVHCAIFNNAQLSITTITGNEVVNQQLTQASLTINMGAYASGIYLITIAQNDKFYRNKVRID